LFLGCQSGAGNFEEDVLLALVVGFIRALVFAEMVDLGISCHVVHPGRKLAVGPKRVAILQDAQENLLHEVLAQITASSRAKEEVKQGTMVALKEEAQLPEVAVSHLQHQLIICRWTHASCASLSSLRLCKPRKQEKGTGKKEVFEGRNVGVNADAAGPKLHGRH